MRQMMETEQIENRRQYDEMMFLFQTMHSVSSPHDFGPSSSLHAPGEPALVVDEYPFVLQPYPIPAEDPIPVVEMMLASLVHFTSDASSPLKNKPTCGWKKTWKVTKVVPAQIEVIDLTSAVGIDVTLLLMAPLWRLISWLQNFIIIFGAGVGLSIELHSSHSWSYYKEWFGEFDVLMFIYTLSQAVIANPTLFLNAPRSDVLALLMVYHIPSIAEFRSYIYGVVDNAKPWTELDFLFISIHIVEYFVVFEVDFVDYYFVIYDFYV